VTRAAVDARTVESRHLRQALGRFATGVTIVTCCDAKGGFVGLTVNSFNSLSLDPPLVLWALRGVSSHLQDFSGAASFAVNVLSLAQVDLSRRFASSQPHRFSSTDWALGPHGAPVLTGCAAVLECATVSHQDAGDHRLFIGRVLACSDTKLPPLVFQAGHYRQLGELI
jgi:flavin reductase (DIM6/NTAB) family NADH-FMN oxidoreductase RutF